MVIAKINSPLSKGEYFTLGLINNEPFELTMPGCYFYAHEGAVYIPKNLEPFFLKLRWHKELNLLHGDVFAKIFQIMNECLLDQDKMAFWMMKLEFEQDDH